MGRVAVQNTCWVLQLPFQQRAADGSPPVKMLGKEKLLIINHFSYRV